MSKDLNHQLEANTKQIKKLEKDLIKAINIVGLDRLDLQYYVNSIDTLKHQRQLILFELATNRQ